MTLTRPSARLVSGLATVLLALLGWFAYASVSQRRLEAGLHEATRDMEAGNIVGARDRFLYLARRWPGRPEVLFRLGESELACGRTLEALAAWSQVPQSSPYSGQAALASAQVAMQTARFSDAERFLRASLKGPSSRTAAGRHLLFVILGQQGRLLEARRLIEEMWTETSLSVTERVGLLRDHLALDLDAMPLEGNLEFLGRRGATEFDDEGLWLARANLATKTGRLEEALRWLDAACLRRPDNPDVWRARLDWAVTAGRLDRVIEAIKHLATNHLSPEELARLGAWLARQSEDVKTEKLALEQIVALDQGDLPTIERLAEIAFQEGREADGRKLRERKSELDALKDRYWRLFREGKLIENAVEMARLAESLGRSFEARAFLLILDRQHPGDPSIRVALGRLDPAPALAPSKGESLAIHFASAIARFGSARPRANEPGRSPIAFENDAASAGLAGFVLDNGTTADRQLPEMACGGIGVLDYNGDGLLDVYAIQGGPFPPPAGNRQQGDRLFRNRGDGTFEDVTRSSGISAMPGGYGHGVSVGDIDNDGHPDLFLTRWQSYALYRNRGDGTFEDITAKAGLAGSRDWPTSSAFADLDNDGDLDLYVCHYGAWDAVHPMICKDPAGRINISCDPRAITALPDHLFRNDNGRFVDVTAQAGIVDRDGRGLGVVAADFDGDGLAELFVANDSTANYYFHNLGGFRFEEVGHSAGVAANAGGGYQAGMGVACGDWDGDGKIDLAVTNFYGESTTLFHNLGQGLFVDHTAVAGLAAPSRYLLGFGAAFLDADNDGFLDLMTANGHVSDLRPQFPYPMTAQIYRGSADGRLTDVTSLAGPPFQQLHVGRGLAVGDLDNDGRVDALLIAHNEPPIYFHNRALPAAGHYLTFQLQGTRSNRDGAGAVVTVTAGGRKHVAQRFGGGSYQSACDQRIHFGLGAAERAQSVEVRWPSGRVDLHTGIAIDGRYLLKEGDTAPRALHGQRP
jgi:tetratricopeptide (TPR) repeat protein